ncbi:MAG: iron ABC transporter permease [Flavobacteriaceae bacterium]|nr:iron ABC transporter permease [Flavobacteriaceae bacterium]
MNQQTTYTWRFILLGLALVIALFLNLRFGSVHIALEEFVDILSKGYDPENTLSFIVHQLRFPKALTAILVGVGLAIAGLIMQTLFRNPLAGPYVLGISSGASLGVSLLILGGSVLGGAYTHLFLSKISISIAASLGSFLVLVAVVLVSVRVKDTMAILIIGLMFGSITAAIVSVLAFFSTAEALQQYLFWSFGSLGSTNWEEVAVLAILILVGCIWLIGKIKHLNTILLGESYAKSMGIAIAKTRLVLLLITSVLAGGVTAFAGPIAFIGLAVPHIAKMLFQTPNHKILIPGVALIGAIALLLCDILAQWPGSEKTLPINAITAIFGAPIVIWLLVRKRKLHF